MERVAVVIAAYRSERTIGRCLASFAREAPEAEVVVVDSAPDGASATIAERFDGVRVVRSAERLTPHAARNRGACETDAPLLLFTDPDIYPRPGSVAALLRAREERGGAIVASFACYGSSYLDRAAHDAKFDLWLPQPGISPSELGPTAGLLVARRDWESVGGFPRAGMLGDTIFSWALAEAGVPLHCAGDAVFEHDHGATLPALVRERFARGREFAPLRRQRSPGRRERIRDVVTTVTLMRPARVTLRSVSSTWRHVGHARALATLPVVAAAQCAWFAGELAGMVTRKPR